MSRDNEQWFLRRITPYRTADNRISGVVLSLTDITQIKRAEPELRDLTAHLEQRVSENSAQLQHERNFIDAILNTVGAMILVIDTEERVVRFNAACNTTTGHDFAEFQGSAKWQTLIPVDEQDGVRRVNPRLRSGEDHIQHENHWLRRDGSMRLISWCNSVLRDDAGQVQYIIGTGIDITEQRHAENRARETLEEASRLQRLQTANELATLLAHELNQPLAAIATYAETGKQLLRHTPLDHDKLAANLERISQQSLRAGEAIRHLRAFVGRGRIDPVPMDLNAVVRSTCTLMAPKTRARGIDIALDLATLPPVLAVDVHIEQVLLNLLRNAIDAIRDARHEQRQHHRDDTAVQRHGPGQRHRQRSRHQCGGGRQSVRAAGQPQGIWTGRGAAHQPQPDRGSRRPAVGRAPDTRRHLPFRSSLRLMNQTVFVVDDDAAMRDALVELLETAGLEVEAHADGPAFLAAYEVDRTGCLLLDMAMPGMTGFEVQAALNARGLTIPIIFLTGHGDIPMAVRAVQAGAVDFLEKPIQGAALLERVQRALALDLEWRQTQGRDPGHPAALCALEFTRTRVHGTHCVRPHQQGDRPETGHQPAHGGSPPYPCHAQDGRSQPGGPAQHGRLLQTLSPKIAARAPLPQIPGKIQEAGWIICRMGVGCSRREFGDGHGVPLTPQTRRATQVQEAGWICGSPRKGEAVVVPARGNCGRKADESATTTH